MNNEFTIKIISDSSGNEQSLNNISIEAADSLKVFIESLTRLAQTYDNYDNVEIRIKMENSCFIDKESNYSKSIRLLNIIYRCEDGAISNNKNSDKIRIDVDVKSR